MINIRNEIEVVTKNLTNIKRVIRGYYTKQSIRTIDSTAQKKMNLLKNNLLTLTQINQKNVNGLSVKEISFIIKKPS